MQQAYYNYYILEKARCYNKRKKEIHYHTVWFSCIYARKKQKQEKSIHPYILSIIFNTYTQPHTIQCKLCWHHRSRSTVSMTTVFLLQLSFWILSIYSAFYRSKQLYDKKCRQNFKYWFIGKKWSKKSFTFVIGFVLYVKLRSGIWVWKPGLNPAAGRLLF